MGEPPRAAGELHVFDTVHDGAVERNARERGRRRCGTVRAHSPSSSSATRSSHPWREPAGRRAASSCAATDASSGESTKWSCHSGGSAFSDTQPIVGDQASSPAARRQRHTLSVSEDVAVVLDVVMQRAVDETHRSGDECRPGQPVVVEAVGKGSGERQRNVEQLTAKDHRSADQAVDDEEAVGIRVRGRCVAA